MDEAKVISARWHKLKFNFEIFGKIKSILWASMLWKPWGKLGKTFREKLKETSKTL